MFSLNQTTVCLAVLAPPPAGPCTRPATGTCLDIQRDFTNMLQVLSLFLMPQHRTVYHILISCFWNWPSSPDSIYQLLANAGHHVLR